MMVRRLSLIVPILLAVVAASTASAQPRAEVGPWGAMEVVGEKLQERQGELAERIEEHYPEFYARHVERFNLGTPLLLTPVRLGGPSDGPSPSGAPPASTPPPPAPAPPKPAVLRSFMHYGPLVLGSLFGAGSVEEATDRAEPPVALPLTVAVAPEETLELPAPVPVPAPASSPAPPPTPTAPASRPADAFLNFADGPFPAADSLAVGSPDSWHKSKIVADLLGRSPSESEKVDFKSEILSKVERSFTRSGLEVELTTEPGPAAHTLSVVSGALARDNEKAIGIADIGGDGFTFLDNFVSDAIASMDDLETAVANNIAHELMHAFGVDYHDASGETTDSGIIGWDLLVDEDLDFSDEAVSRLSSVDFQRRWNDLLFVGAQVVDHGQGCSCHPDAALATPEPATLATWTVTLLGLAWSGRRWRRTRA